MLRVLAMLPQPPRDSVSLPPSTPHAPLNWGALGAPAVPILVSTGEPGHGSCITDVSSARSRGPLYPGPPRLLLKPQALSVTEWKAPATARRTPEDFPGLRKIADHRTRTFACLCCPKQGNVIATGDCAGVGCTDPGGAARVQPHARARSRGPRLPENTGLPSPSSACAGAPRRAAAREWSAPNHPARTSAGARNSRRGCRGRSRRQKPRPPGASANLRGRARTHHLPCASPKPTLPNPAIRERRDRGFLPSSQGPGAPLHGIAS